jgi:hypothetical protein
VTSFTRAYITEKSYNCFTAKAVRNDENVGFRKSSICTCFSNGKKHDFRLFKESGLHIHPDTQAIVDTGYQGLQKIHPQTRIPKKKSKKRPLTPLDKESNQALARDRVFNENVIALIKRFKIVGDRYRNRRKRFGLRFNLISAIYNFEVDSPVICG